MSEPLIDVRPDHWAVVADILRRHVPDREVWAFGSRATWNAKEYSDLDLAIIGEAPLSLSVSAALADDFAESDLPFKVDVVDWATTSESFREIIERDKVVVKRAAKQPVESEAGEWPTMTLRKANVTLIDCDHRTPPAADTGYPYIAIPQLRAGRIDLRNARRITREHYREWTRKARPSANDVILSRRCNPGETAVAPPDLEFALGQNLVLLRADGTKVYSPFLRWLVRGPEWWNQISKFINVGAVFDSLKCADVPNFELRIPPIPEQRAIAHILGTLDDKIELNRRMNETLEAMARALFKSWFVDFDPVRAKMNLPSPPGRGAGGEGTQPFLRTNDPIPTELLDFARQLRRQATDAETLLWRLLRGRQLANAKFRRQYAFPPYILDFYCHELKLAVELDGGQHNEDAGRRRDARRDEYLAEQGIRVLRFWNNDVLRETEAVLEAIYAAVVEHSNGVPSPPPPLPQGEGSFGIPKSLADVFPTRLVNSEFGEIPEGWGVVPLPSVIEVNPSRSLRKGEIAPYLDMANMPTQGHTPDGVIDRPFGSGMRFVNGDTLVARITPCLENGKTAYVDFLEKGQVGWGSTEYIVLHPKPPLPEEFAYCLARSDAFREFAIQSMTGSSGRQRVPAESLSHYMLAAPPEQLAKRFGSLVRPLFTRASAAARESRTLAVLRDTLLPELINGELRVKDAERVAVGET